VAVPRAIEGLIQLLVDEAPLPGTEFQPRGNPITREFSLLRGAQPNVDNWVYGAD